ncbi:hypothetical protein [Mesorhizobium sp. WSM3224]|jgi:hypothetical protein|uniref:hypothetical protein n=1 Tax=Mesorhizobium sp. WSM3224 TaxID=1040986 RepID=UPI0012EC2FD8|nr:hypothetical protein [Mesorhizobium sp. WSM3224]
MASEIFSFIKVPLPRSFVGFLAGDSGDASRQMAGDVSGEKSGVKNEGNQTGADETSFFRYGVQGRILNKV